DAHLPGGGFLLVMIGFGFAPNKFFKKLICVPCQSCLPQCGPARAKMQPQPVFGLKARNVKAQAEGLGKTAPEKIRALKGRYTSCDLTSWPLFSIVVRIAT